MPGPPMIIIGIEIAHFGAFPDAEDGPITSKLLE